MKGKTLAIILGAVALLLVITGVVVYKTVFSGTPEDTQTDQSLIQEELPPVDESISVDLVESSAKANTVVIKINGMGGKMSTIAYELTYDSNGLIKGVNSGSKPLEVAGEDSLEREIYLGTCSRNVCTPDTGVSKVSLAMIFTDTEGKQTQFTKDYTL